MKLLATFFAAALIGSGAIAQVQQPPAVLNVACDSVSSALNNNRSPKLYARGQVNMSCDVRGYNSHTNVEAGRKIVFSDGFIAREGVNMHAWITGHKFNRKANEFEVAPERDFEVYPNPTSGQVFVVARFDSEAPVTITIVDMLGKVLYTQTSANHTVSTFELNDHPKGVYFVRLQSAGQQRVEKVVLR